MIKKFIYIILVVFIIYGSTNDLYSTPIKEQCLCQRNICKTTQYYLFKEQTSYTFDKTELQYNSYNSRVRRAQHQYYLIYPAFSMSYYSYKNSQRDYNLLKSNYEKPLIKHNLRIILGFIFSIILCCFLIYLIKNE